MRYTWCASFRQGFMFQVSLARSSGAFLSAIVLTQYLPYSRAYVSLSTSLQSGLRFLGHRSNRRYLVGTYSFHRPSTRTDLWLFRSDLLFSETLRDLCYPPNTLADGYELARRANPLKMCMRTASPRISTVLVKPFILRRLV
jgi:hypothetical protein